MNEERSTRQEWHYRAFVLRLWATEDAEPGSHIWRFSLEDTRTGERRGFATLEQLMAFMVAEMRQTAPNKAITQIGTTNNPKTEPPAIKGFRTL